jgi:hypothetical protein
MQVHGVAFQLNHPALFDLGEDATAPDAHLTGGWDVAIAIGVKAVLVSGTSGWRRDELPCSQRAGGGAAQLKKITA